MLSIWFLIPSRTKKLNSFVNLFKTNQGIIGTFGLTLYEWGLTQNPTDRLANLTLNSLIKPTKLATIEALKQTLSPINFDFKLDNNLVNSYLASLNKYGLVKSGNLKKLWSPVEDLLQSYVTKASLSSADRYALNLILYMADLRYKARL